MELNEEQFTGEAKGLEARVSASPRKAKIVCTIGPSSNSEPVLRDLMRLGMDVARLNFSHGTHEDHARVIERLRKVAEREGRTICILQDLQGPKIRTGRLKFRTPVALKAGSMVTITSRDIPGTSTLISTTFKTLAQEVEPGARILLSDGLIELRVRNIRGEDVECEIINGGMLGEHKGINLPGTVVRVPSLTEKDEKDLEFGLQHGVDMIAVSFIRTADDVRAVKRLITAHGSDAWVVAKLEKPQAIEHLEEILDVADSVMVARGDLGVEMPPEKVPIIQKHIIRRAYEWRKPVITATQMLESMIENPRPTRAEASDVANAIFDGTDAVMLSAETANGKYPREAVSFMARITLEAESHMQDSVLHRRRQSRQLSISETICESVAHAAQDLDMRAIAVYTETGTTARLISKYRPQCGTYGFSSSPSVCARLNLLWGVQPVSCGADHETEAMVLQAERMLLGRQVVREGDVVAIVAGTRTTTGSTNFMRLHVIGSGNGVRPADSEERRKAPRMKPMARLERPRKRATLGRR
ncbi:MAG TPA: pyruvate kinase [Candidatus Angelobacter sp.]|nr:pyruvate kinase [Candidatus Angelobacter sp.]